MNELLTIKDLHTYFYTDAGVVKAVDNVSLSIASGKTLAIVGESGSGKSITAASILRIIPQPPGKIVSGSIILKEKELLTLSEKEMLDIRGNRISIIFQEPMTSLNPVLKVGFQIEEVIQIHQHTDKEEAKQRALELMELVGIPATEQRAKEFPHQLSGGLRQRVMIAMALACRPELLIADEPTTALDVTVQAQILDLMRTLQQEFKTAILLITHDLGVVAEMADEVAVMYAGQIVEYTDVNTLFEHPAHPYTRGLLESIPRMDIKQKRLHVIEGTAPQGTYQAKGCRFIPRCLLAAEKCREQPALQFFSEHHDVRCHFPGEVNDAG